MGRLVKALALLGALAAASISRGDLTTRQDVLANLASISDPTVFALGNTSVVSQSGGNATVRFNSYLSSVGQNMPSPANWSGYHMVSMTLTNHESRNVNIKLIVQVRANLNDYTGAWDGGFVLKPGQTARYVFHLSIPDARQFGFEVLPPPLTEPHTGVYDGPQGSRTYNTVYHWRLSHQDTAPATVTLSNLRLMTWDLTFWGLADKYGQFTHRTWPDKILGDANFAARRAAEQADLASRPTTGEPRGTTQLPQQTATLRWRVAHLPSGKWYFVTPDGRPFWSLGVNGINTGAHTVTEGRLGYFQELPPETGRFAPAYAVIPSMFGTRKCYNFHLQNLMHKYGDSYEGPWADVVRQRLSSWGLNTVGMQSEDAFTDGSLPYTLLLKTTSFSKRLSTKYTQWGTLPDPYDSNFQSWCTSQFSPALAGHNGRWGFIGVFVDNELSWGDATAIDRRYNVAFGALNASSTQPAKLAFLRQLAKKYRYIGRLNRSWGSSFASWQAMKTLTGFSASSMPPAMLADFDAFQRHFAMNYYGKVRAALNAAGCTGLYLGSRFAMHTPEIIAGATPYVDVHSFNVYRFVENAPWEFLGSLSKPVLISEWCVTVQDRGTFGGVVETSSHADRATEMRRWLDFAIQQPNIVGAHWFLFYDQPATGRYTDGENMGMGLLDVADTPYYETVNVFRSVAQSLYLMRG